MPATDDLFTRLGKIFGAMEDAFDYLDGYETQLHGASGINAQFAEVDRFQVAALNGAFDATTDSGLILHLQQLRDAARSVLIEEMDDIAALASKDFETALVALKDKMATDATTIAAAAPTIAALSYAGPGGRAVFGSGILITTVEVPPGGTDKKAWSIRGEPLVFECIRDAQDGQITEGAERFNLRGADDLGNLDRSVQSGSGFNYAFTGTHAGQDETMGEGGNLLKNSDFEDWTATDPDSWNVVLAATNISENTVSPLRGGSCMEWTEDAGSTLTQLRQRLTAPAQTAPDITASLKPLTTYCLSFWARDGGTAPTAGVLRVQVEGGAAYTDSQIDVTLTTLTATYSHHFAVWHTDEQIVSSPQVTLELTTAMLVTGESILIDELTLFEMRRDPLRLGSLRFGIVAGGTAWAKGDRGTVTAAHAFGKLQRFLDASFDQLANGIHLPGKTGGAETYADALVS